MVVVTTHLREAVHGQVYQEFVVCNGHRARYRQECFSGSRRRRRRCRDRRQGGPARPVGEFLFVVAALFDRDRGLQLGAPLGAVASCARPSSQADPACLCEALRSAQQERCGRRGGDLRGGGATEHALCGGAQRREPGTTDAPPRARTAGGQSHANAQRLARPLGGDRDRRGAGGSTRLCAQASAGRWRRRERRNGRPRCRAQGPGTARSSDRCNRRRDRGDRPRSRRWSRPTIRRGG